MTTFSITWWRSAALATLAGGTLVACAAEPLARPGSEMSQPPVVSGEILIEQPWWQRPTEPTPTESSPPPIDTTFTLSGDVLFEVDSAVLSPAASSQLTQILHAWRNHPGAHIVVEGHTDSDGADVANQQLSEERSASGKAWFVTNGVPEADVLAVGYGETQPVAPNDTDENRALNRRCEITVTG